MTPLSLVTLTVVATVFLCSGIGHWRAPEELREALLAAGILPAPIRHVLVEGGLASVELGLGLLAIASLVLSADKRLASTVFVAVAVISACFLLYLVLLARRTGSACGCSPFAKATTFSVSDLAPALTLMALTTAALFAAGAHRVLQRTDAVVLLPVSIALGLAIQVFPPSTKQAVR